MQACRDRRSWPGGIDVPRSPTRHPVETSSWRPTLVPALLTFSVMMVVAFFAASQNFAIYREQLRAEVVEQVSLVRARLEGNVAGNIQLVRGLLATLETELDMDETRFGALAERVFATETQLRNLAIAKGMVITMVYPRLGNEKAIGLDFRKTPAQFEAAERARTTGKMVLAGPVDLVQGGRGFIARFPVFAGTGPERSYWGLVAAVIDVDRLYAASGVFEAEKSLEIAIAGRDGSGSGHDLFHGRADVLSDAPITADVALSAGNWRIYARPIGGWPTTAPSSLLIWGGFLLIALLVTGPILVAGLLIAERQRNHVALRERQRELVRLSRRLNLALDTSEVGVFEYVLESGDIVWDERVCALYGVEGSATPPTYMTWRMAVHPEDRERAAREFRQALDGDGRYHSEFRIVTPAGVTRHIRAIGAVFAEPEGGRRMLGVNWDVSADAALNEDLRLANRLSEARNAELEATRARIEHNALHDSLTGLPNRRFLDQWLQNHPTTARAQESGLALLHIDLDRFKQINDTLGHAAGDAMLVHVADVLRARVQTVDNPDDFVARIGGDEFVMVCHTDDEPRLAQIADAIVCEMRRPIIYSGHECRFGVSVGIAAERGSVDARRLLVNADIALYRAKSRGRNRYEFFNNALEAEVIRTKRVADEILNGLDTGQFVAYFQPQFDARTREIIGAEALVRWNHPTQGLLSPAAFLDVAEDLNVVSTIDRLVLEQSLAAMAQWRALGLVVPRVSVNVSARRLQDDQLIASLRSLAIAPGTIAFELVESIFLDETDEMVRWNIEQIKDLGIDIEIDDFGTGYASIVSLMQLKPYRLKIARQLVEPIVDSVAQRRLLASIVDIGRALGIEVLGEGVETEAHARILCDLGCASLQGYLLARPMPASELPAFAAARSWLSAPRRAS
jgi:diguanylate cyclase (GGDEF)-like protein